MENGIKITGTALGRLAARVTPAFEARNCIPVLGTARLSWGEGKVSLSLSNLDLQIDSWTEAETFGTGAVQIPFPTLIWICRSAGDQRMDMAARMEGDIQRLDVNAGILRASLNLLCSPEDFPTMAPPELPGRIEASQSDLLRLLSKGRRCISTEETRYYLNGSYLHGHEGKARAVSTDGHRMARIDSDIPWPDDAKGGIWPTGAIDALRHLMVAKANEPVMVEIGGLHFRAAGGDWRISGKLIDGTFPDYTRVIPTASPVAHVTISKAGLRPLLMAPACGDRHRTICFDTAAKLASIRSSDSEFTASVGIEAKGQDMRTGYSHRYVADLAREEGILRFDLTSPDDPARIHVEDPAALFILMPRRI